MWTTRCIDLLGFYEPFHGISSAPRTTPGRWDNSASYERLSTRGKEQAKGLIQVHPTVRRPDSINITGLAMFSCIILISIDFHGFLVGVWLFIYRFLNRVIDLFKTL
jgi:hypothetical protein